MQTIDVPLMSDPDVVFGTTRGLPAYEDVPEPFRRGATDWNRLFSDWFYGGLEQLQVVPHDGIDQARAVRHLRALMVSFEPKHEHKEAGVAFLMSRYFRAAEWVARGQKRSAGERLREDA